MAYGQPEEPRGLRRLLQLWSFFVIAGFILFMLVLVATGAAGFKEVQVNDVAVKVNYISGTREVILTPGYKVFLPVISEIHTFDRSPNEFVMAGESDLDSNHVHKLTVRANDGSNFWFETLKIHYQIIPEKIDVVVDDSGQGDAFKYNWVKSYARAVLRDEFGRFNAEDIANPTNYGKATMEAKRRLNEHLNPHGIEIIQIVTPKPKFVDAFEKAIENRKLANQEVQKLQAQQEQLQREKERRLGEIERDKKILYESLLGELEAERIQSTRDQVKVTKAADAYKISRLASGTANEAQMIEEARGLAEKYRKEAEGLEAKVLALAAQGEIIVREALAEKLRKVEFTLVPYDKDGKQGHLEHRMLEGKGGDK